MAKVKLGVVPLAQLTVTAGVPLQLSAVSLKAQEVLIQADPLNNGVVYIGDASVTATQSIKLNADRAMSVQADDTSADEDMCFVDLSEIYIDGSITGDKVNVMILQLQEVQY